MPYAEWNQQVGNPNGHAAVVADTELPRTTYGIYIPDDTVVGDLAIELWGPGDGTEDGAAQTYKSLRGGWVLQGNIRRVLTAGTTNHAIGDMRVLYVVPKKATG